MVRTKDNESLIREIEGGIKKEVSIGCNVGKKSCSICGKTSCSHVKGKLYGEKLCFKELSEAVDAYEWSFVAVPAQREAGVSKKIGFDLVEKSFRDGRDVVLVGAGELDALLGDLETIKVKAEFGERSMEKLFGEIRKNACALGIKNASLLVGYARTLPPDELEEFAAGLRKAAGGSRCFTPQLSAKRFADGEECYV